MATALSPRIRHPTRSIQSFTSDKPSTRSTATKPVSLARRLLFPHLPADADLPPLLASPAAPRELNAELYDFIALALRAFVNPWWTKLTRYDREFLPEITRVLAAVVRALEARILATDLAPLAFRDLPALLTQHIVDFRTAQAKLHTAYAAGGAATLPQLFHRAQPHMAVSADGRIDEEYVRQAVDQVLRTCLPPEDYTPETERYLVREIVLKVLLDSVLPRITQPWFIHKLILDLMGPEEDKEKPAEGVCTSDSTGSSSNQSGFTKRSSHSFSLQSLAIFFLSAIQSISGVCLALIHAYKQARDTIKKVNQSAASHPPNASDNSQSTTSASLNREDTGVPATPSFPGALPHVPAAPDYTHPPLTLLLTLFTPPAAPSSASAPARAPASTALALAHTLSLLLTALAPFLSRLLPYLLYAHALSPTSLISAVRAARRALFPEGWPAPPPPDPTPEEQVALRAELSRRLLARFPAPLAPLLGPTPAARAYTIDSALAPLSSQACNAHLALLLLDLVLLTLFPEMGASEVGGEGAAS
ncbi:PXA domain protein 1 [Grifola frondosa]|uniref:PXA domain protein 1 n=1 Tax=Grifola frondosa TaxID=5627 RepID=A0A1C7MPS0_GRIFR|nr:PXA domain protein 1 [Grifola frondosa]